MQGMARSEDLYILRDFLKFSLGDQVPPADTAAMIGLVASNSYVSAKEAWEFVRLQVNQILAKLGGLGAVNTRLGPLVIRVVSGLGNWQVVKQLDQMGKDYGVYFGATELATAKELVQTNMAWMQMFGSTACDYFLQNAN